MRTGLAFFRNVLCSVGWSIPIYALFEVMQTTILKTGAALPVKRHVGDAMIVDECPSNNKTMKKLVGMEKYVHFAREEALGYSGRQTMLILHRD